MADATPKNPRACAACQAPLLETARFCPNCGAPAPPVSIAPPSDPIRDVLKVALGRQYEIQRLLGRGGMGAVYLATEAALEREVAIKVLPPDRGATQDSRDRFRREARTAAKLSHPNIVPLYTFGDVDGTLYFVMGYVKGESLAARLKREGRLPIEDARRILIEIADALDYAHKLGIIHRDIKPDNVLLEEGTGRALLTDFGVAKALGAGQTMTEIGGVLGTPQYMSPEQAQGKADIDHRSDLYSLGVMGYAMFSGRLPFEGPTPGDVMVQHITKEAPALRTVAPEIPVEIATALTRCLAKEPVKRWVDAKSLKQAIAIPDDDETPPQLDGLGGFLVVLALGPLVLLCLGAWWLGGGDVSEPFPALLLIVSCVAGIPFLLLTARWHHLRRLGFESGRILQEIMAPMHLWPGWHPRRFRRRGDVWDRLPPELRQLRLAYGWTMLAAAMLVPAIVFMLASNSYLRRTGHQPYGMSGQMKPVAPALFLSLLAINIAFSIRFELFCRRRGGDAYTSKRLIGTPTFKRSYWSKPEVAALLLPANAVPVRGASVPASPRDMASAVSAALTSAGAEVQPLALKARAAADGLARTIADLDGEIASLESAADPGETERLAAKIAALGARSAEEAEGKSQMRDLFEKQLDLLRGVTARLFGLRARRDRQRELLKALWTQAIELTAVVNGAGKTSDATDRLRTLCTEADEHVGGPAASRALDPAISDAPTMER